MDSEKENPLEELYVDADEFDQERVKEALSGIVGISRNSGQPRFYNGFEGLSTDEKFVSLLLYRKALDSLGEIGKEEEVGEGSSYFDELLDVDPSTVRHKVSDLDFVRKEGEKGGYFVPAHNIQKAVNYIEEARED
jgi:hypothetical protein